MYQCYSSATMTNNTVAFNIMGCGIYSFRGAPVITNCILWGSTPYDLVVSSATYSDIGTGITSETGNISADPMFVDPANGDYHLLGGSPCIDVGSNSAPELPDSDKDGNLRVVGVRVDMGAYEYPGPSNQPPVAVALVNGQESVTIEEESWLGTTVTLDGSQSEDLDGDDLAYAWDFTSDGSDDSAVAVVAATYSLGGPYTATLTVSDPDAETSTDTVTITVVPGPPENQLDNSEELIVDCVTLGLIEPELEQSLVTKVQSAMDALARGNPNAAKVAMNDLKAFINQVEAQTDKKIDPDVAAEIIERINRIIADLAG